MIEHEGEILGSHRGLRIGVNELSADDGLGASGGLSRGCWFVDGGWVSAFVTNFSRTTEGGRDTWGYSSDTFFERSLNGGGETPSGAAKDASLGDDVPSVTGGNLGDADDALIDWVDVSADERLERGDDLTGDDDRVDGDVRLGGVGSSSDDRDFEDVEGGHDRAGSDGELADRHAWPVVQAEDSLAGKLSKESLLDHDSAAPFVFLGGLEDEMDGAVETFLFGEKTGGGQEHSGMAVVAAGVHFSWMPRLVGKTGLLVDE
jgi:hypothetical protein